MADDEDTLWRIFEERLQVCIRAGDGGKHPGDLDGSPSDRVATSGGHPRNSFGPKAGTTMTRPQPYLPSDNGRAQNCPGSR